MLSECRGLSRIVNSNSKIVKFKVAGCSDLVELPQVLLLCLIDYSQDSGDGFADNTAEMKKQKTAKSDLHSSHQKCQFTDKLASINKAIQKS